MPNDNNADIYIQILRDVLDRSAVSSADAKIALDKLEATQAASNANIAELSKEIVELRAELSKEIVALCTGVQRIADAMDAANKAAAEAEEQRQKDEDDRTKNRWKIWQDVKPGLLPAITLIAMAFAWWISAFLGFQPTFSAPQPSPVVIEQGVENVPS